VSFLFLQLSNSFLRILVLPNKAVFCNSPVLIVTPSFSSHASNRLLTTPSAPTTTGTTSRCLIPHSLPVSLFLNLFTFFFIHSVVPGWSYIHYDCLVIFLLNNNVRSSGLDNWMVISHKILNFSFSTIPLPGDVHTISHLCSCHTYNRVSSGPIWQYCRVFSCTLSVPTSNTHLECDLLFHLFGYTSYKAGIYWLVNVELNIICCWIISNFDSIANGYIWKWLNIPTPGTPRNVFLECNKCGLNICPPSVKFTQCQTVLRYSLNEPRNDSLKALWKLSSSHINIQHD